MLGLLCREVFSLVVASGGYSLAAEHRVFIAVASVVAEQGLQGAQAPVVAVPGLQSAGLSSYGSWA